MYFRNDVSRLRAPIRHVGMARIDSPRRGLFPTKHALVTCLFLLAISPAGALEITIVPGESLAGNTDALAAFERAAQQWESRLEDAVDVRIEADLTELSSGVIGETSSRIVTRRYTSVVSALKSDAADENDDRAVSLLPSFSQFDVEVPSRFGLSNRLQLTSANAKSLGLIGTSFLADATVNFSIDSRFDFDNSDGVRRGTVDFETAATHEIGHVLGFISAVDDIDFALEQNRRVTVEPTTLDLFRFDSAVSGNPETDDEFIAFARSLNPGGSPISDFLDRGEFVMSSGESEGDGYQASHWKTVGSGAELVGIMQPALPEGVIWSIREADLLALDMIGWDYEYVEPAILQAGDADQDFDFDQKDLVAVLQGAKYLTGQPATWGEGDWDGSGDTNSDRLPEGDGVFDQQDIVAALATGNYLNGPYAAVGDAPSTSFLGAVAGPESTGGERFEGAASLDEALAAEKHGAHFTTQTAVVSEPSGCVQAIGAATILALVLRRARRYRT